VVALFFAEEVPKLRATRLVGAAASTLVLACTLVVAGPAIAAPTSGPTVAAARAEAAKINLVSSDLPAWTQSPNVNTSSDDAASDQLAVCSGAQDPAKIDVADINSPYFDQGNTEVTSDVTVVRDRGDALQGLAGMKGKKLLPCLQQMFIPDLKKELPKGAAVSGFKIGFLAPDWLPPYSFGYRVRVAVSAKSASGATVTEDLVSDQYGFLVGETEVGLSATQSSPGGFAVPSAALEQRLFRLLQSRADRYAG
jgi:hypothetical protein